MRLPLLFCAHTDSVYRFMRTLVHDYLAIMVSSVSSESTFSSAGITIMKHRNCLNGDIVEALQCLKSLIHQDLLFHKATSASQEEWCLDVADKDPANHEASSYDVVQEGEDWSWDHFAEGYVDEDESTLD